MFQHYKSAEAHTGHEHVKLRWFYVIAAMLVIVPILLGLVGFMGYRYYQQFKQKANIEQTKETEIKSASDVFAANNVNANLPENMLPAGQQNQDLKPSDFVPTLAERPESKPIYNSVRQVKQFERIAACVKGGKTGCTCYSDQATPLCEVTKEMCIDYATNGIPFDPFREPIQDVAYQTKQTKQIE